MKKEFDEKNIKYDDIIEIIDRDLLKIDINNYKEICSKIIKILNKNKLDKDLIEIEKMAPEEKLFANNFYRSVYNAILRNSDLDELDKDTLLNLKNYYFDIFTVTGVSKIYSDMEDKNEKTK